MLDWLDRVLEFFGGAGPVLLSIIGFLLAAPYVDRFVVRRKRLTYRVLYNSKLGVGPETPHVDGDPQAGSAELREVMGLLDRMSMVVIRIRNNGSYDIHPDDFEQPLSFTFGRRVVWNARISDASTPQLQVRLKKGLSFFTTEAPVATDDLPAVRERLRDRVARWLSNEPEAPANGEPQWHGVRLEDLELRRRQKAKLVVVLHEPVGGDSGITKSWRQSGKLDDGGLIRDEKREPTFTLPKITRALAAVLTLLLVLFLVFKPERANPGIACVSGELRIEGSSVVVPTVRAIAEEYVEACGEDTRITAEANGSIAGVRSVLAGRADIALSDGRAREHGKLYSEQGAIVVFHVVVNGSVGVNTLTTADLRKIHDGTYTNWRQIAGGKSLPIRIVGRGQDSGTRLLFERNVLGTGEGGLSSDECVARDRPARAPIIRCERESNAEVVQKIAEIPGAIGYADVASTAQARHTKDIQAVTIDGKAFDSSTAVDSGYPFWTVEYVYTRAKPQPGSLAARFIEFLRDHELARARLAEAGFRPCDTSRGPLDLCNLR